MPLKNNLRIVMAEKMIDNLTDLIGITGLSRNALNKLWHNQDIETIKLETLFQICDSLKIKLSDLLEYIPDTEEGVTNAR
jgi:putative transcriptional regulator